MSLFDITTKKKELQELENKTLEPNFWDDNKESGKVLSKIKSIKDVVLEYSKLYDEASSMADVADEKWREVNSLYIKTGKTRVSRVINNFKYR